MKYEPISQYKVNKIVVHPVAHLSLGKRSKQKNSKLKKKKGKSESFAAVYEQSITANTCTYNHLKAHVSKKQYVKTITDNEREL